MQLEIPPAPTPPAPPKRPRVGLWVLGIIGGLLVLGAIGNAIEDKDTTSSSSSSTYEAPSNPYDVTAEDVVDIMQPSAVSEFCREYDLIGDYDAALYAFTGGYGPRQDPSAQEVFDEMLSRC
jgi:hypothetical protein